MSLTAELQDPRRHALLEKIPNKHGREAGYKTSLLLWFADVESLENLANCVQPGHQFETLVEFTMDIFGAYFSPPRQPVLSEMPLEADTVTRQTGSTTVRKDCLIRDKNSCVITRCGQPCLKACRILPYWFRDVGCARNEFWSALELYWPEEKVQSWRRELLSDDELLNTKQVQNLITLSLNARVYWHKRLFALKPIESVQYTNTLKVEFWWLPIKLAEDQPQKVVVGTRPDLVEVSDSPRNNIKLFDTVAEEVIESGKVITFTTPDPEKYPLPSFRLLEMQWHLHRIMALSGLIDYDYDEEEYDEVEEEQEEQEDNDDDDYGRSGYDSYGYDRDGYDCDGYDCYGYDRYGYDSYGYDRYGYDCDGYDRCGYDRYGHGRDEYDSDEDSEI